LGARASLAGAGGGGQGSSELEATGDEGGPGTTPELEAPGQGGVDGEADIAGDVGSDIAKMPGAERKPGKALLFPMLPAVFRPVERDLSPSSSRPH
jgi:hypothetical protein